MLYFCSVINKIDFLKSGLPVSQHLVDCFSFVSVYRVEKCHFCLRKTRHANQPTNQRNKWKESLISSADVSLSTEVVKTSPVAFCICLAFTNGIVCYPPGATDIILLTLLLSIVQRFTVGNVVVRDIRVLHKCRFVIVAI